MLTHFVPRPTGANRRRGGIVVFWQLAQGPTLHLDFVSIFAYTVDVTAGELKRRLAKAGCTFEDGKKHLVVYYKRRRTILPRHSSQEIKKGTYWGILKRLGIKESEL